MTRAIIRRRRKANITARAAAAKYGVTPRTIRRVIAEPRDDYLSRAEKRQDEALRLYESGLSYQGVADEMGVSRNAAAGLVRRARAKAEQLEAA